MTSGNMRVAIGGAALVLIVAACGAAGAGTPEPTTTAPRATPTTMVDAADHEGMAMDSGDPHATLAYEVTGAAVVSGPFRALPTTDADEISGTAWLARRPGGTTVSIELEGLQPGVEFVSHVHADACSANGGPHYRHDEAGMEHPPNEIHLAFAAGPDGEGTMTVENPTVASDRAVSVVVHEAGEESPKLVCADLSN